MSLNGDVVVRWWKISGRNAFIALAFLLTWHYAYNQNLFALNTVWQVVTSGIIVLVLVSRVVLAVVDFFRIARSR